MKTKYLSIFLVVGIAILTLNGCAFLRGTGSTTTDSGALCLDYKNSEESKLEVALIHKMTELYQNNSEDADAKAVWFDLETLKKFTYHLEMAAKKNNVASQDLGVRIYYGRYPNRGTWNNTSTGYRDLSDFPSNPKTNQYEMLHTVVMVPTIKKDSVNHDFDPLNINTYTNGLTPAYNPSFPGEYKPRMQMLVLSPTSTTRGAQNHGELYPPYSTSGMDFVN